MIEGVIRHCTEMAVDRQYVDSHGQSEVAFAFWPELTKCADLTDKGTKIERSGGRGEENQRDAVCLVSCTGLPRPIRL